MAETRDAIVDFQQIDESVDSVRHGQEHIPEEHDFHQHRCPSHRFCRWRRSGNLHFCFERPVLGTVLVFWPAEEIARRFVTRHTKGVQANECKDSGNPRPQAGPVGRPHSISSTNTGHTFRKPGRNE